MYYQQSWRIKAQFSSFFHWRMLPTNFTRVTNNDIYTEDYHNVTLIGSYNTKRDILPHQTVHTTSNRIYYRTRQCIQHQTGYLTLFLFQITTPALKTFPTHRVGLPVHFFVNPSQSPFLRSKNPCNNSFIWHFFVRMGFPVKGGITFENTAI